MNGWFKHRLFVKKVKTELTSDWTRCIFTSDKEAGRYLTSGISYHMARISLPYALKKKGGKGNEKVLITTFNCHAFCRLVFVICLWGAYYY
jgi:hypothetical protein